MSEGGNAEMQVLPHGAAVGDVDDRDGARCGRGDPEVVMTQCLLCRDDIQDGATICKTCKSPQQYKLCRVCRRAIPKTAKYCNECKSYQARWLRHLPASQPTLALLVALVTVISPAVTAVLWFRNYDSHTSPILSGPPNNNRFPVTLWNTGGQPSGVSRCWIEYQPDNVETPLTVMNNSVIAAHGQTTIQLVVPDPTVRPSEKATARLWIQVQESNRMGDPIELALGDDFVKAVRVQYDLLPKQ
jgi:hypothetical protein